MFSVANSLGGRRSALRKPSRMPIDPRTYPHSKFLVRSREKQVDRMSTLLAEQQTMLRIASKHTLRNESEAVAGAARDAGLVVVMLRHHLARLGADLRDGGRAAGAPEEETHSTLRLMLSRPHLFHRFRRRLTRRLWRELVRGEDQALAETLDKLSSARWSGDGKERGADASRKQ